MMCNKIYSLPAGGVHGSPQRTALLTLGAGRHRLEKPGTAWKAPR